MMHFGRYFFNADVIDYIELQGDGSYIVHLAVWKDAQQRRSSEVHVEGVDAEALREWLDEDRRQIEIEGALNEAHLKEYSK